MASTKIGGPLNDSAMMDDGVTAFKTDSKVMTGLEGISPKGAFGPDPSIHKASGAQASIPFGVKSPKGGHR